MPQGHQRACLNVDRIIFYQFRIANQSQRCLNCHHLSSLSHFHLLNDVYEPKPNVECLVRTVDAWALVSGLFELKIPPKSALKTSSRVKGD